MENANRNKAYDISSLNNTKKREKLKGKLDKYIKLDNNNNEGENIEDQ
jgi:hypothetical protein